MRLLLALPFLAALLAGCATHLQGDASALECAARIMGYPVPETRARVMVVSEESLQELGAGGSANSRAGAALMGIPTTGHTEGVFRILGGVPFIFVPEGAAFATLVHERVHELDWRAGLPLDVDAEARAYAAESRIAEVCNG